VWLAVSRKPPLSATIQAMATTVLIVDDHPSFRASARTLLEDEGFDVVGEADNGQSALEAVERLHPDLVLLDVQLPDFDGFQVVKRLRCNSGTPCVVLTSSRDASDFGATVTDCGALGFIAKAELSGAALTRLMR
jgi:DNA-binding NarL/FixJ family response regulator